MGFFKRPKFSKINLKYSLCVSLQSCNIHKEILTCDDNITSYVYTSLGLNRLLQAMIDTDLETEGHSKL